MEIAEQAAAYARREGRSRYVETHQSTAAGLQGLRAQLVDEMTRVRQEHTVALQEMRERSSRVERRLRRFVAAFTDGPNGDSLRDAKIFASPQTNSREYPQTVFRLFWLRGTVSR